MENKDFTTTLLLNATPSSVFEGVNNVRGWWSGNVDGKTDEPGSEFVYHYQDVHRARIKITEFVPDKKVVWHVLDNYFRFTKDKTEWKDTQVVFEISEHDGKTELKFTHRGLVPEYECFQICRDAWTHYVQDSLKDLILTGTGNPTPVTPPESETGTANESQAPVPAEPEEAKSIHHRLLIEAPVETVYRALTTQQGLAGWWTPQTKAKPETGSVLRFGFGPDYFKEMKVEELKPYSKVKWLCLKAQEEWIGTTITFELEPHPRGAVLHFHHDNWKNYTKEFAGCSYHWALFLQSLESLCEKGKGTPYPEIG